MGGTFDLANALTWFLSAIGGGISVIAFQYLRVSLMQKDIENIEAKMVLSDKRVDKLEADYQKDNKQLKEYLEKFESKFDNKFTKLTEDVHQMSITLANFTGNYKKNQT